MTRKDFRKLALTLPEATENEHMDHPDFRVRGKIFATLGYPDERWGMVKLMPDQQEDFAKAEPDVFVPVKGAWGRGGATSVLLRSARTLSLKKALALAWRNAAPKKLSENFNE
ncbi:MAG: MmcQ/YjbR family DNA-binding protein [Candidatus Acidiferrales bacterium]